MKRCAATWHSLREMSIRHSQKSSYPTRSDCFVGLCLTGPAWVKRLQPVDKEMPWRKTEIGEITGADFKARQKQDCDAWNNQQSSHTKMTLLPSRALYYFALPGATLWLRHHETEILRQGVPLTPQLQADARRIGVKFPARVRLRLVKQVPEMRPLLRWMAQTFGLCDSSTRGMSLRYGIYVRSDCGDERPLLVHELVHTWQYERLGGIHAFLKEYLYESMVAPGYPFGRLEQEASTIARDICR